MTLYDATSARHYHWEVEFVKLTNRLKGIISNARYVLLMVVPAFIVFSLYYWSGLTVYTSMS